MLLASFVLVEKRRGERAMMPLALGWDSVNSFMHPFAAGWVVSEIAVIGDDFTTQNGMLTPSLKVKRRVVWARLELASGE